DLWRLWHADPPIGETPLTAAPTDPGAPAAYSPTFAFPRRAFSDRLPTRAAPPFPSGPRDARIVIGTGGSVSPRCMDARVEGKQSADHGAPAVRHRPGALCPAGAVDAGQPDSQRRRADRGARRAPGAAVVGGDLHEGLRAGRRAPPPLAAGPAPVP